MLAAPSRTAVAGGVTVRSSAVQMLKNSAPAASCVAPVQLGQQRRPGSELADAGRAQAGVESGRRPGQLGAVVGRAQQHHPAGPQGPGRVGQQQPDDQPAGREADQVDPQPPRSGPPPPPAPGRRPAGRRCPGRAGRPPPPAPFRAQPRRQGAHRRRGAVVAGNHQHRRLGRAEQLGGPGRPPQPDGQGGRGQHHRHGHGGDQRPPPGAQPAHLMDSLCGPIQLRCGHPREEAAPLWL